MRLAAPILSLLLFSCADSENVCNELELAFREYRHAIRGSGELAIFFSHDALAGWIDSVIFQESHEAQLHNARAIELGMPFSGPGYSDLELSVECLREENSLLVQVNHQNVKEVKLGYVHETGEWRIGQIDWYIGSTTNEANE